MSKILPSLKMGLWGCVLCMLLFLQSNVIADDFRNSKEYNNIWKNTYTALYTLTNTLNNPNTDAIGTLNKILISDSVNITDFNSNLQINNPLLSKAEIKLNILNINKLTSGYMVRIQCLILINKYQFSKEFSIRFDFINNSMKISEFQKTLSGILTFKSDIFTQFNDIPQKKLRASTQKSLSVTNYQSDNLIDRINLYNNPLIGVFDVNSSKSVFNNNEIFSRPYGILAYKFIDVSVTNFSHNLLFATDSNWDRLIVSDDNNLDSWIKAIGNNGTGNYEYRSPQGVDNLGMNKVFVADGWNNRVQAYNMMLESANPSYDYAYTISDNFNFVADVAVGYMVDFSSTNPLDDSALIAVLDKGNCKVKFFDDNGNYESSIFSCGSGPDQLSNPTSICFARDINTNYQTDFIYVADAGNNRAVVRRITGSSSSFGTTELTQLDDGSFFQFPSNAYLTSVSVDYYGYVYVVDQSNSKIYKFTRHFGKLVAIFGSHGTSDTQLNYPNKFMIAKGDSLKVLGERFVPMADLGDAIVTEMFGNQSGIRRYKLGNDILEYQATYLPKMINYGLDWLELEWFQTGITERWVRIYFNDILIDDSYYPFDLPLDKSYSYDFADSALDGYYRYEITTQSIYGGVTPNTIIDSIYIVRYTDPGPQFVIDSVRIHDPSGELASYCLYKDPDKWWVAKIYANDNYNNAPLTYYWLNHIGKVRYDTTSTDLPWTSIWYTITDLDSVYFKIPSFPSSCSPPLCIEKLFTISITDEPYDVSKIYWYDYTWDTLSVREHTASIYSKACETICLPDCPPPPGCPKLFSWDTFSYQFENNILPQSEYYNPYQNDKLDYYPIFNSTLTANNEYKFIISEIESEITYFDQVELYYVDIPLTDRTVIFDTKQRFGLLRDTVIKPISAITNDSIDILAKVIDEDGSSFISSQPGHMIVEYDFGSKASLPSQTAGLGPDGGIGPPPPDKNFQKITIDTSFIPNVFNVYVEDSVGVFIPIDTIPPRDKNVTSIVKLSDYKNDDGLLKVKLEWSTEADLNSLPFYEYDIIDQPANKLTLLSAIHTTEGEVNQSLDQSTIDRIELKRFEQIELTFTADTITTNFRRLLYFKFKGRYISLQGNSKNEYSIIPNQFSLHQNYPNPFNPSTTFEFDLPITTDVKLEIFNVLGQKVKTLINSKIEAGSHRVEWDGWDNTGSRVASGIYFAKFSAGEYNISKKMVVLK